jgi:hypothetical protein
MLWAIGGAAERHRMHRFCSDLAKLALQMAAKFGHNVDKWYGSMILIVIYPHESTVGQRPYTSQWFQDMLLNTSEAPY